MKPFLAFLSMAVLSGCSSYAPMAELEAEALSTGDWSKVEKRERVLARQRAASDACPKEKMLMCNNRVSSSRCHCVDRAGFNRMISGIN